MTKLAIWSEDDATVGQNDHEYLEGALKRIFGLETASKMLEMATLYDYGCEKIYKLKLTISSGTPGNSSIIVEPIR